MPRSDVSSSYYGERCVAASGSRTVTVCFSFSCIDGFRRSSSPSRLSAPRRSCAGTGPGSAGTGGGNPAPLEAGRTSTRTFAR